MASNTMDFIVRFRDEASAGVSKLSSALKSMQSNVKSVTGDTKGFASANKDLSQVSKATASASKETGNSLKEFGNSAKKASADMEQLSSAAGNYRDANGRLRNANGAFIKDTERASGGVKGFSMSLKGLGPIAAAAGGALAAVGMADFAKSVMSVGMEFDAAISEVSALSGAQGDALQSIRDKAKEIGSTTSLSASEAASAFKYMSRQMLWTATQ